MPGHYAQIGGFKEQYAYLQKTDLLTEVFRSRLSEEFEPAVRRLWLVFSRSLKISEGPFL